MIEHKIVDSKSGKLNTRAREIAEKFYTELLKAPDIKSGKLILEVNITNGGIRDAKYHPPEQHI